MTRLLTAWLLPDYHPILFMYVLHLYFSLSTQALKMVCEWKNNGEDKRHDAKGKRGQEGKRRRSKFKGISLLCHLPWIVETHNERILIWAWWLLGQFLRKVACLCHMVRTSIQEPQKRLFLRSHPSRGYMTTCGNLSIQLRIPCAGKSAGFWFSWWSL